MGGGRGGAQVVNNYEKFRMKNGIFWSIYTGCLFKIDTLDL